MRSANVWRAMFLVAPAMSAWIGFSVSARAHALDVLLGQAACGNLLMTPQAPVLFGHCLNCWSAGATSAAAAWLALFAARGAVARARRMA